MGKILKKGASLARGTVKFGGLVALGAFGTSVAAGVKARNAMENWVEDTCDGLNVIMCDCLSMSRFEEIMTKTRSENQAKREGRAVPQSAWMSTAMNDGVQYGG